MVEIFVIGKTRKENKFVIDTEKYFFNHKILN